MVPVAKYRDMRAATGNSGVVRGGEFVQIYQRQSQGYVYRDSEGAPRMFRPPKERAEEQTTGISVADRVSTRADLAWQIEVPSMMWSGSAVRHQAGAEMLFSLKDSMSGQFLQENEKGGGCFFDDGDDTAFAQWRLVPFDRDVDTFLYEKTPFMIKNSATGHILHRGEIIMDEEKRKVLDKLKKHGGKRKAGEENQIDEDDMELATEIQDELFFELAALEEDDIKEDDLFIFRALTDEWVREFRNVQQDMSRLQTFAQDLEDYGPKGKKMKEAKVKNPNHGIDIVTRKHLRVDLDDWADAPVIAVLERFLLTITVSSNDDPLTREGLLDKPLQRMFSEFRITDFLVKLIRDKIFTFIPRDDVAEQKHGPEYLLVVKYCFRLLGQMCKNNSQDSAKLFECLESFLMVQLGYPWKAADVISQMFNGSEDLIRSIESSFIERIWVMAKEGRQQRYVDFMAVLLVHDNAPIKENQDLVIAVIEKDFVQAEPNMLFSGEPWASREQGGWAMPPAAPITKSDSPARGIPGIERETKKVPLTEAETDWVREFSFHMSLVKLAGLLCAGRHRASIDLFLKQSQFKFSYSNVLQNVSKTWSQCRIIREENTSNFGANARLQYTALVFSLFVDREPFELRSANQGIRVLPFIDIDQLGLPPAVHVDPYKAEDGSPMRDSEGNAIKAPIDEKGNFFSDLKETILAVLKADRDRSASPDNCVLRATDTKHNQFICALLDLARQMLLCGLYDGGFQTTGHSDGVLRIDKEAQDLAQALLPVLDGRTDETTGEDFDERNPERSTRFYLSYENGIIMTMKRKVLEILNVMFGMRASTRIEELLKVFYADDDHNGIADILEKHGGMFDEEPGAQRDQRQMSDLTELRQSGVSTSDETGETKFHNPLAGSDDEDGTSSLPSQLLFEEEANLQTRSFDAGADAGGEAGAFESDSTPKSSRATNGADKAWTAASDRTTKLTVEVTSQTLSLGANTVDKTAQITGQMMDKSLSAAAEVDLKDSTKLAKDVINLGTDKVVSSIEMAQSATFAARKLVKKVHKETPMVGFTNVEKTALLAEEAIAKVSIFRDRKSVDGFLTDILVDLTRYHMDPALAFQAFNTLIFFVSQSFVFQRALHSVTPIGNTEDAKTFLEAMARVSEFRRLRKWLHEEDKCQECIKVVEDLTDQCSTRSGQDLLRNLNLEEYTIRVLRMRLPGTLFETLLRKVLHLVEEFCDSNTANQDTMAVHVEQIFLKLLNDEKYIDDAAHCMRGIIAENEAQSAALSGLMVSTVNTLAMRFGRRLGLLSLLQALLVVDGEPVVTSQLKVCKGAMMSKDLIEVGGALEENEWALGPAIGRIDMLQTVLQGAEGVDRERCLLEAEYYNKSLQVLAECANGKNPTTELLCSSMMPLTEVITRLHEIFDHPKLQRTEDDLSGVKNSTMAFFREVFVDTNSSHILRTLRRPANGVWTIDPFVHEEFAQPIAFSLKGDLSLLTETMPEGKTRYYVFEQCVQFFIQYACVSELKTLGMDELDTVIETYTEVLAWVKKVQQYSTLEDHFNDREKKLLHKLESVCVMYINNEKLDGNMGTDDIKRSKSEDDHSLHRQTWNQVVEAVVSTMLLGNVAGTDRTLGVGIMSVGKALWKVVPEEEVLGEQSEKGTQNHLDQVHFASFLVTPLQEKLESLQFTASKEELPDLLMMIDAVRSIPYGVTAFDEKTTAEAFKKFLAVEPLDSAINPDVARVQTIMVKQGWGLLCFQILGMETLPTLHLPALRLLLALTGGGNTDVQDELLRSLDDPEICPNEICATNFRRLLRSSISDLKLQRKALNGTHSAGKEVGFALEVLQVLRNMTLGDHVGMQVYLQRQPGHPRELDLISDVVGYLNQIERDLKDAVIQTDNEGITLPGVSTMMERAFAALRVLISMCTGPNRDNQVAVALTDIISVINRILYYCDYRFPDLHDSTTTDRRAMVGGNYYAKGEARVIKSANRPRRKLNAQISRLLLTLLEGTPHEQVIQAIVGSLNWSLVARHLATMKMVMTEGYVPHEIEDALEVHPKGRTRRQKGREFHLDGVPIDRLPDEARAARWMKEESFKFITIVEKCYQGSPSDLQYPLDALLEQTQLVAFFQERLGEVEVVNVKDHKLERLFFWMPDNYLNKEQRHRAERSLVTFMNAVDRADDETKLRQFIDGASEVVSTIDQEEIMASDLLVRINWAVDAWLPGNAVMFLSLQIVLICVVSFDHRVYSPQSVWDEKDFGSGISHFVPAYGRLWETDDKLPAGFNVSNCYPVDSEGNSPWFPPISGCERPYYAWYLFTFVALVHLVVCGLAFYTFLEVRVPVLLEQSDRMARLAHLKRDSHHARSDRIHFLSCTVHAYGFSEDVASEKTIRLAFGGFGVVSVVRAVKVKGFTSSWAMVTFSDPKAVKKLQDSLQSDSEGAGERYVEVQLKSHTRGRIFIRDITEEYIEESMTLKKLVADAEFELLSRGEEDVLYTLATALQQVLNVSLGRIGRKIPLQAMIILRLNPELWSAIADIIFSVAGFWWSPLLFSYHLSKLTNSTPSAMIVVKSITTNWGRLLTTVLLSMFALYLFAVTGLLLFDSTHIPGGDAAVGTGNDGGPCANLLTCVVSYSYSGLMQEGVGRWLLAPNFPEQPVDMFDLQTARIVWEILFMMATSCAVIAIITGIICDTFGELRMQQDDAAAYRASTCFVTGISYSHVPQEKGTHYVQYMYLLLYLRRLDEHEIMPLEQMVRDQVNRGDVRWLPNSRCMTIERTEDDSGMYRTQPSLHY